MSSKLQSPPSGLPAVAGGRGVKLKPNQFFLESGQIITENPLLFQSEMVKAVLEGRKTQTRRVIKNVSITENVKGSIDYSGQKKGMYQAGRCIVAKYLNYPLVGILDFCKYGKPGDLLWVRETWGHTKQLNINPEDENYGVVYRAAGTDWENFEGWTWKPSIHMPKSASRIWLMVEDIRVERVKEITEYDSISEGVEAMGEDDFNGTAWKDYLAKKDDFEPVFYNSVLSFRSLWIFINGEESWRANPWVWVILFRVLSTTGKPSNEVIEQNYLEVTSSPSGEAGRGRKEVTHDR